MSKRELLAELILDFEIQKFYRFLSATNSSFKPVSEDFSHYLVGTDSYFSDFRKAGQIEWKDGRQLLVSTIKVDRELTDKTSKKKQYDLVKKVLKDLFHDGGLFLFYDADGKFRLSFICAQYRGTSRGWSPFRRYTYFVSQELSNKTFINQVGRCDFSSIEAILQAFSIEAVSEDFYKEFKKDHFDKIAKAVTGLPRIKKDLREDFALLFAIRVLFLGFVQKKGWLGGNEKFIQHFWNEYKSQFYGQDQFYDRWLIPMFFQALNSQPGQKVKWGNNDFSSETEKVLQMAPFLNGELFKPKNDVDDQELTLPDSVIGEYIEWLFTYNFTIEENDCYDEELELNPEFLGIIFERLVNKVDGAVYTPRTEVDLMCRLALVNWLSKNSSIQKRELYYQLFREGGTGTEYDDDQKEGNFSANEIRELLKLLESVTVCDPAAGSGAFEVGMLHVINETIESLHNNSKCPEDIDKKSEFERKKAIIANSLYGVEVKRWAVWINQLRLWLTLFIDMPDEMKLSLTPLLPSLNFKIRRGDSLVQRIGTKLFPVHGHADVTRAVKKKITELKKAKLDFFYNRGPTEELVKQQEFQVFRAIIHSQIEEIDRLIALRKRGTDKGASGPQLSLLDSDSLKFGGQQHLLDKVETEKNKQKTARGIELETQKKNLWDELNNLGEEHPLIWSIEFSEIFYGKGGFGIIIGNPPYVRQEDISDPDENVEPKKYKSLLRETIRLDYPKYFKKNVKIDGKSDLYTFFYLRGLYLLNENGIHVFICSNSWLDVGYGAWMQEFLLNNVPICMIIDNHARRSFASSDVNTIISVFGAPIRKGTVADDHIVKFVAFKKPFEESIFTENLLEIEDTTEIIKNDVFRVYPITNKELYDEGWEVDESSKSKEAGKYMGNIWGGEYLRAPDIYWEILEKAGDKLVRLNNVAQVKFGIKSGSNNFFYLTKQQVEELGIEEGYLKPLIKTPRSCPSIHIKSEHLDTFAFWCRKSKKELTGTNALEYINWGEKQGFHELPSVQGRHLWYELPMVQSNILWWKSVGERYCCFWNPDNYFADQRNYPIKCKEDFVLPLLLSLNCTFDRLFLEVGAREMTGAYTIIELSVQAVQRKFTINPAVLKKHPKWQYMSKIFKEMMDRPILNLDLELKQRDRQEIDLCVAEILGLKKEHIDKLYETLMGLVYGRLKKSSSIKKR